MGYIYPKQDRRMHVVISYVQFLVEAVVATAVVGGLIWLAGNGRLNLLLPLSPLAAIFVERPLAVRLDGESMVVKRFSTARYTFSDLEVATTRGVVHAIHSLVLQWPGSDVWIPFGAEPDLVRDVLTRIEALGLHSKIDESVWGHVTGWTPPNGVTH